LLGKYLWYRCFSTVLERRIEKSTEENGGKVGSSISAKTNYVVAGDNMGPAKLEKAIKLNIPFYLKMTL
jgi:DNA ligase (NAD+)